MMVSLEEEKSLRKKALKAEWYQKNKEKIIARSAEWRKNNVEKARRTKALYRLKRSELKEKKKELPEDIKECSRCKEEKHISGFHKDSSSKSGIRSYCKACASDGRKTWYASNKDLAKRSMLVWREANQEKIKEYTATYYEHNKDKNKRRARKWAAENPERANEKNKKWREENKERIRESSREYRIANPLKKRICEQNRRVRKKSGSGRLSRGIVEKLLLLQKGKCACCKKSLKKTGHHIDHIVPLALEGPHEDSNVQLLCPTCNCKKHAKHPIDFMQSRGFLL